MTVVRHQSEEMTGGEEKTRYRLLEISDPSTLLIRGEFITSLIQVPGEDRLYENDYTWLL